MSKIKIRKLDKSSSCRVLSEKYFMHDPAEYLKDPRYSQHNGTGVNISIIGTGAPFHRDYANIEEYVNFSQAKETEDFHGTSAQLGGIIGANNPEDGIVGMAFDCGLYFAKALDDNGSGDMNSLNASLLWSLVKNVDMIVIPFELPEPNEVLKATMEKINKRNIAVIMYGKGHEEIKGIKCIHKKKRYNIWTTSTGVASYVRPSTKLANLGVAAGAMAIAIGKLKKSKKELPVEKVYNEFDRIL